jgi:putative transcriptional regulator
MSTTATITVVREPGDPHRETGTDWSAVHAKTEEELYAAALADPDAQPLELLIAQGWKKQVNPKKLRERLGLTQEEFAAAYGIPVGTLRDWEQRRKNMDATARAYLLVIEGDPKAVASIRKSLA